MAAGVIGARAQELWLVPLDQIDDEAVLAQMVEEFCDIFSRHVDCVDELSNKLFAWQESLAPLLPEIKKDRVALQMHLNCLRDLLLNPLDLSPLKEPVLASGRVWEKWMLQDYTVAFLECFGDPNVELLSPYDGAPLIPQGEHHFAQELYQWLATTAIIIVEEAALTPVLSLPAYLNRERFQRELPYSRLQTYERFAQAVLRQEREKRDSVEDAKWERLVQRLEGENALRQQALQEHYIEHEVELRTAVERIEIDNNARVDLLQEQVEHQRARAQQALEEKRAAQERVAAALNEAAARQQTINALRNQVASLQGRVDGGQKKRNRCVIS